MNQNILPPVKGNKRSLVIKIFLTIILAVFIPFFFMLFLQHDTIIEGLIHLVVAIIAVLILVRLLKPLGDFLRSIKILSDGNFNHRMDLRSGDEFEEIGNSFNLMAENISKIFQQLENDKSVAVSERDKFDEILSSIIDGIIALDFNKNIIHINKAAEELTGYTQDEVRGKPMNQLIHIFSEQEEILPKSYCQGNFNQTAGLVGKNGRQTKISLATSQVGGTVQTNLNCILILHDLSREEELEQMKLDFVSMASHELKTPLTSIIGYLSVFLDESKGKIPQESLDLLNKAFISSQQLQTLIQNLLNVNKIEKEQLSVSPEPTDIIPIYTKAIEDLRSQANQKNIVLNLILPTVKLPKVSADPMRLNEVITNLVSNAINYTNAGGKVEISTVASPIEVTTTVSDTGVGIPKEAIPHLFNKFFIVSNELQKANKGTGLGLYISKSIIEKLRGRIWAESETGSGSRFSFTLPVATQTAGILENNRFVSQAIQSGTLNY